jgi:hypothetical protein
MVRVCGPVSCAACSCAGRITAYDPDTGKHHVSYEDGDEKDYVMSERTWDFEVDGYERGLGST